MNIFSAPQYSFMGSWGQQTTQPSCGCPMLGNQSYQWPGGLSGNALEQSWMGPGVNGGTMGQMLGGSIGTGGWNDPQALFAQLMQFIQNQPALMQNGNCSCPPPPCCFQPPQPQPECRPPPSHDCHDHGDIRPQPQPQAPSHHDHCHDDRGHHRRHDHGEIRPSPQPQPCPPPSHDHCHDHGEIRPQPQPQPCPPPSHDHCHDHGEIRTQPQPQAPSHHDHCHDDRGHHRRHDHGRGEIRPCADAASDNRPNGGRTQVDSQPSGDRVQVESQPPGDNGQVDSQPSDGRVQVDSRPPADEYCPPEDGQAGNWDDFRPQPKPQPEPEYCPPEDGEVSFEDLRPRSKPEPEYCPPEEGEVSFEDLRPRSTPEPEYCPPEEGEQGNWDDFRPRTDDKPLTEQQAAQTLLDNAELADQAAGIGDSDGQIGTEDLEALAASPDLPDEVQRSAEFYLQNDPAFHHTDSTGDGQLDNLLSVEELQTVVAQPEQAQMAEELTLGTATQVVNNHFDTLDTAGGHNADGYFDTADLQAIVDSPDASEDLKRTSQYFLDNPALRNGLDTANGQGGVDGVIGKQDVEAALTAFTGLDEKQGPMPTDLTSASQVLTDYMNVVDTAAGVNGRDGVVGLADLQAIRDSPDAAPQLVEATRLMLDNPTYFNNLDGATAWFGHNDDLYTLQDLQKTATAQ